MRYRRRVYIMGLDRFGGIGSSFWMMRNLRGIETGCGVGGCGWSVSDRDGEM